MKHMLTLRLVGLIFVLSQLAGRAAEPDAFRTISRTDLRDRIEGGWAGQMIGVSYGAITEFKYQGRIITGEWEQWRPEFVARAFTQDDLYGDMGFLKTLEAKGLAATSEEFGVELRNSTYGLAHANLAARRALRRGVPAADTGLPRYNVHANDIDFQIDVDGIGLMCPGLPQLSNAIGERAGRIVNSGDGLRGGLFMAGMYAAAFFETNPRKVVESGLTCIPANSPYALLIRDVLQWSSQHPQDWKTVWQLIQTKWDQADPCPEGALLPYNIDARINGANVVLGLLYGGSDFAQTIDIATRGGHDSDCNPASAGGIWGAMYGYRQIPETFRSSFPSLAGKKFAHTDYTFQTLVDSTLKLALAAVQQTGGKVAGETVTVKLQSGQPADVKGVDFGKPVERIALTDPRWTWKGNWQDRIVKGNVKCRLSREKGAVAEIRFEGSGAMVGGPFLTTGGGFRTRLDDQSDRDLDVYDDEDRGPEWIWHRFDLAPGWHTLQIIVSGEPHPGSQGAEVGVHDLVVFQK